MVRSGSFAKLLKDIPQNGCSVGSPLSPSKVLTLKMALGRREARPKHAQRRPLAGLGHVDAKERRQCAEHVRGNLQNA